MVGREFEFRLGSISEAERHRLWSILAAALQAVDPDQAVKRAVSLRRGALWIGERHFKLESFEHIYVVGFGKAATPMARAIHDILTHHITAGVIVTKTGHGPEQPATLGNIEVYEASHPIPDQPGVQAARKIAEMASAAGPNDLVICLISGGGSALLTLPAEGLVLEDLQTTTDVLLRSGATITEVNTVRKHLSAVKGGQLMRMAWPATVISLIISDVVGSPLDAIASGSTVPDATTWLDVWEIVRRYDLSKRLPAAVLGRLTAGKQGTLADTPKATDAIFSRSIPVVVADNRLAAEAARDEAIRQGYHSQILSTFVQGEAREVAKVVVAIGQEIVAQARPLAPPACMILGGETTVTVRGQGQGGRNQELALAAALALDGMRESDRMLVVSFATDGSDGPTDAAGALADGSSLQRGRSLGLDAAIHLSQNNAYPYLQALGDLIMTGPTRTNVNDLIFLFVT